MKELKFNRKITLVLFGTIAFCLFMPQTTFCQTEKLDIVEYTPPKGWTKTPKEGAVTCTVDNHIARLRQKIEENPSEPQHIITVHRIGYKFLG